MQNDDVTEEGHPRSKVGSVARPVPGWDVQLLTAANADYNEHHGYNHENVEKDAELVVKLPLPPGTMLIRMIVCDVSVALMFLNPFLYTAALVTLHQKPDDFCEKYFKRFPGYYHTGDTGHIDEEGFVYVRL